MKPILELPFDSTASDPIMSSGRGVTPAFSRSSIGQSQDEQGNLFQAGLHIPRWKRSASGIMTLLLEKKTSNYIPFYSEYLGAWTSFAGPIYPKTQIAPTGDYDADEVVFLNTLDGIFIGNLGTFQGLTVTFSFWVRMAAGSTNIDVALQSNASYLFTKPVTTSWVRHTVTQTFAATDVNPLTIAFVPHDTSAPVVFFWGIQLELGSFATSYYPTTAIFRSEPNLIVDGDIELGIDNWIAANAPATTVSVDRSIVKFGKQSVKVVNTVGGSIYQNVPTVVGENYIFSAWVYVASGQVALASNNPAANGQVTSAAAWVRLEMDFKATATSYLAGILATMPSTYYVDRVSVRKQKCGDPSVESPAGNWLLISGAGFTAETGITHSGTNAGRINTYAPGDAISMPQSVMNLSPNTWYRTTWHVYIVSQSVSTCVPVLLGDSTMNMYRARCKPIVGVWQRVTAIFGTAGSIPAPHSIAMEQVDLGTMVFIYDNVSVEKLDYPGVTREADNLYFPSSNNQSSNLCLYSEEFDNPVWNKSGAPGAVAVTANAVMSPIGTMTAERVVLPIGYELAQSIFGITPGAICCFSVWMRADTASPNNLIQIWTHDGVGAKASNFSVTSQWRRYQFANPLDVNAQYFIVSFRNAVQTDLPISVYLWGAQFEKGFSPSKYVMTGGAPVLPTFKYYASSNIPKRVGSLSFRCLVPWAGQSGAFGTIIGQDGVDGLVIYDSGPGVDDWYIKVTGIDKTGAKSIIQGAIPGTANLDPAVEHFVVVTWGEIRDVNGKIINTRLKVFVDGMVNLVINSIIVQEFKFNEGLMYITSSTTNASIRDLKIWPAPLTEEEMTNLYANP